MFTVLIQGLTPGEIQTLNEAAAEYPNHIAIRQRRLKGTDQIVHRLFASSPGILIETAQRLTEMRQARELVERIASMSSTDGVDPAEGAGPPG